MQSTGWVFNNLTYLPSHRSAWASNPLGAYGKVGGTATWRADGRDWRTECDSPATGQGGCRSYIRTTIPTLVNGSVVNKTGWVFNNLVRFSNRAISPVTAVPSHLLSQVRLTPQGLGPLQVGASAGDLVRLGYAEFGGDCDATVPLQWIWNRGIEFTIWAQDGYGMSELRITKPSVLTDKGARVGMTIGEVRNLHGAELTLESKYEEIDGWYPRIATVRRGHYELLFLTEGDLKESPSSSDVVDLIIARRHASAIVFDGCWGR